MYIGLCDTNYFVLRRQEELCADPEDLFFRPFQGKLLGSCEIDFSSLPIGVVSPDVADSERWLGVVGDDQRSIQG